MAIANPALWRPNTSQWIIAEALVRHDLNRKRAFAIDIRPNVGSDPLVFKGKRADATYGELAHEDQCRRAWYRTGDVLKAIREHGWDREAGMKAHAEETAAPTQIVEDDPGCGGCENGEHCGACECCPTEGFNAAAEMRFLVSEVRRIRDWLAANDPEGEIDHISYRPIKDGRKMIEAGIPAKACLHAMAMHWDRADRQRAQIADYDPATEFPGGLHGYLDALVKSRVLIMLTGPAGMGKSYWTESLAKRTYGDDWKTKRALIPCSEGMSPSWFVGKDLRSGFAESKFQRIWRTDGIIQMDEMDRSDSNILTLINDALANDVLDNPVERAEHERGDDVIIVATTNTLGLGADDQYVGANQLDFSTIDRFRMGRAFVGYSRDVEDQIAFA